MSQGCKEGAGDEVGRSHVVKVKGTLEIVVILIISSRVNAFIHVRWSKISKNSCGSS